MIPPMISRYLEKVARHKSGLLRLLVPPTVILLIGGAGYRMWEGRTHSNSPEAAAEVPDTNLADATKFIEIKDTFRKNETVTDALLRHGLTNRQVYDLVQAARPMYDLAKVRADKEFTLHFWLSNDEFNDFIYAIDYDRYLTVYRSGETYIPLIKKFPYEVEIGAVEGIIQDNLIVAVSEIGEEEQLALDLQSVFQWDVDFYTDLRKGDSFRMLLERKFLDGEFARYGNILTADLTVQGKRYSAYRFQNEYYDDNGKALKKSFLKSPLKYARISSRYSTARMHPILKIVRPHLGVDYAAPTGTPVAAVASGRVISAGVNGGYGKSVHLKHANGYETMYSHLSSIAVRAGMQVTQGQLIGRVGATGLATGPHLDFRLMLHGKPVNPSKAIVPDAPPVPASQLPAFAELRDGLRAQLERLAMRGDATAQDEIVTPVVGESSK
jgi:murein DD-endopeptidase MepM/ murein hydrolase activator NlpD